MISSYFNSLILTHLDTLDFLLAMNQIKRLCHTAKRCLILSQREIPSKFFCWFKQNPMKFPSYDPAGHREIIVHVTCFGTFWNEKFDFYGWNLMLPNNNISIDLLWYTCEFYFEYSKENFPCCSISRLQNGKIYGLSYQFSLNVYERAYVI